MQSEQKVTAAIETYADMIKRICFYHLKNPADTEDVFQNVFLKYMMHDEPFFDDEHEKAWLIRVAINACKDQLRSFFRRNTIPLEQIREMAAVVPEDHREVLEAVLSLPSCYRIPPPILLWRLSHSRDPPVKRNLISHFSLPFTRIS